MYPSGWMQSIRGDCITPTTEAQTDKGQLGFTILLFNKLKSGFFIQRRNNYRKIIAFRTSAAVEFLGGWFLMLSCLFGC